MSNGLLVHRIDLEAGHDVADGVQLNRHILSGSADQLLDAVERFRAKGVGDISLVLGHDDASARATLDVLATDALPRLR